MSTRLNTILTLAASTYSACAAPIKASPHCQAVADKLRKALDDDASICAKESCPACASENSSYHGARAEELNAACSNSMDRATRNEIRRELDRVGKFCFEGTLTLPESVEPRELTDTCKETLYWIDEVLGRGEMCLEDNEHGVRRVKLLNACEHAYVGGSRRVTRSSLSDARVQQRMRALKEADDRCMRAFGREYYRRRQ